MLKTLEDWNKYFVQEIGRINGDSHAPFLPVIPDRPMWDTFLVCVGTQGENWRNEILQQPACLLVLYCGLAFYEYEENTFWPLFAKAVGCQNLPGSQQTEINTAFAAAANHFQLKLKRNIRADYVGSAISFIGIPLSLWDGFLEICDWALWRRDWNVLSDEEWNNVIERRSGSRKRLKHFLTANRESTSALIKEMLDAREILTNDQKLTIKDIAQASLLRTEYFDEVPETADFLRPQDPDSLFRYRVRLVWDEHRRNISLLLPSVNSKKQPAFWQVGLQKQKAASSPDDLPLNSEAFSHTVLVTLQTEKEQEKQRVHGVNGWGLFDLENGGRLVNFGREQLPLKSYILVSQSEIEIISRSGFDENENQVNERFELSDGTVCFLTRLWPTGKYAELCLRIDNRSITLRFRTRAKVEACFIAGWGYKAAHFNRTPDGKLKIDHLPIPCVAIPHGYFKDNFAELNQGFRILIDGNVASGKWTHINFNNAADRDYYRWDWHKTLWLVQRSEVGQLNSLSQLKEAYKSPDISGDRNISIEAKPHICLNVSVQIVNRTEKAITRCWENLPGEFIPMFLLCQSVEGMKWEDLLLAKDVIAPRQRFSSYILHKYERTGSAIQRNRRWFIRESRAELIPSRENLFQLNYYGDPSILWGLYRRMSYDVSPEGMPVIEVIDKRGEPAHLKMIWPIQFRGRIGKYLQRENVAVGGALWTH